MNDLVKAREEQRVGQPIHHPAPGELASEDDRTLRLSKKSRVWKGVRG